MTSDREQRRVVLIFGESHHGKSYLAKHLHVNYGYHLVELDGVYVEFVRSQYPDLYLPALGQVIAQHFNMILVPCDRAGITPGAIAAWPDHVASLVEAASREHHLVSVEGYLLSHALTAVQERLAATAVVTTIEARYKQYFVASSIEQILGRNEVA